MYGVIVALLLNALIAYLWGSIPAGYWIGKLLRGKDFDIRRYGSHRIGATNVLRTLGKVPALFVFLFDISKGVVPILPAIFIPALYTNGWGPTVAGLAALLGHCFPLFIGFKGGRGVSTGAGSILMISPFTFLISVIATVSTIVTTRYVSLGSIVGGLSSMICGIIFYTLTESNPTFFAHISLAQLVFLLVAPLLVIIFHHDNIGRLLAGTESKIGQKVETNKGNEQRASAR
jgi:glycerol-3-phosphate acyltransferase PlsY